VADDRLTDCGVGRRSAGRGLDVHADRLVLDDGAFVAVGVAPKHRARAVIDEGLVDDARLAQEVLIPFVGEDLERVKDLPVGVLAERQSQPASECLLGQDV